MEEEVGLAIAMRIIELDASRWKTSLDFTSALKIALRAPDWHGSSVNAFVDSMVTGGVNAVEPPYVVKVVNSDNLDHELLELIRAVSSAVERTRLDQLSRTGDDVAVALEIAD